MGGYLWNAAEKRKPNKLNVCTIRKILPIYSLLLPTQISLHFRERLLSVKSCKIYFYKFCSFSIFIIYPIIGFYSNLEAGDKIVQNIWQLKSVIMFIYPYNNIIIYMYHTLDLNMIIYWYFIKNNYNYLKIHWKL